MDGLVLDTEPGYCLAWQQAAAELGQTLPAAFYESLTGLPGPIVEQRLCAMWQGDFDKQAFYQLSETFWRRHVHDVGIAVKPGFYELLEIIGQNQIPYCLATNSPAKNALECLQLAGISDCFKIILSRDSVNQGKPAPDIFLAAAEALRVNIRDCLVLEDSYTGIIAASMAGAPSVYIPSTLKPDPHAAALCSQVVAALSELVPLFQAINNTLTD